MKNCINSADLGDRIIELNTLVLGIGNTLLCDEGAGIHALEGFRSNCADLPGLTCIDGGTLSFTLAAYIEDCDNLIVFDAAELGAPAGSVRTLVGDEMDAFLGAAKRSPHEVGLLDLFDIARLTGSLPAQRALIGIQPGNLDWNLAPTAAVADALPGAVAAARALILQWSRPQSRERNDIGCANSPATRNADDNAAGGTTAAAV
jgi:hydrogenase maturation protease